LLNFANDTVTTGGDSVLLFCSIYLIFNIYLICNIRHNVLVAKFCNCIATECLVFAYAHVRFQLLVLSNLVRLGFGLLDV